MSSGRLILGYGAGWYEEEYRSYGFDYPSAGIRIDMFKEGVEIIRRMWTESPANFVGAHYRVENVFCEPRPDPQPVLMLGGGGEKRTLKIVAEQADWWNDVMRPTKELKHKLEVLENHCVEVGRNYDEIRKTLAPRIFIDSSNKKAKEMAGGRESSGQVIAGDPSAIREQLDELVEMGFDFVVATFPRFQELDDMKLFVNEVMPYFE
jgi:alkanesulfonate monooxygenase SsuD/methylene tetrahydromethanopterin reductase-like flavin-dependent oxidoreductase (luciferase family)